MDDVCSIQDAINKFKSWLEVKGYSEGERNIIKAVLYELENLPSAQPEVIPHRNYKYLSDFWCECGWHLGKQYSVKYCAECGRKVKWDG